MLDEILPWCWLVKLEARLQTTKVLLNINYFLTNPEKLLLLAKVLNTYLGADPQLIRFEHYLRFRSNLWGLSSDPIAATRVGLVTAVAQINLEFFLTV